MLPGPPEIPGYEVMSLLGAGAMAQVWAATARASGEEVAIKVLPRAAPAAGPDRFLVEVEATAAVSHPNVVRVLDAGALPGGERYLVLERVRGASLEVLLGQGALGPCALAGLLAGAARGLAAAHARGVLHRDVKPANILVDEALSARVVDFGLAALAGRTGGLTSAGLAVGTPAYMAPEVLLDGSGAATEKSDVFALGVVLFEGLAARHPFLDPAASPASFMARLLTGTPAPLPSEVPSALASTCLAALARDPSRRPTAQELAASLEAVAEPGAPSERSSLRETLGRFAEGIGRPSSGWPATSPASTPARVGPYLIEGSLAAGGMGVVLLGRHDALGVQRAIKLRRQRLDAARFAREARALARVPPHPGVVRVHDADVDGDVAWLAMDLVEGAPLSRLLAGGPLAPARALTLVAAIGDALAHLHAHGVVHRDVKAENVVVAPDGAPVLVDFGVVRDLGATSLTATHQLVGTPCAMAPEQVTGEHVVGPPADVWALGVLLFEALVGAPPFEAPSLQALLELLVRAAPPTLPTRGADAPPGVEAVVRACLARSPADRPSAAALAAALRRLARGQSPGLTRPHRRRARLVLAAALLVGAGVGLAWRAVDVPGDAPSPPAPSVDALAAAEAALIEGDLVGAEAALSQSSHGEADLERRRLEARLRVAQARARLAVGDLVAAGARLGAAADLDPAVATAGLRAAAEDVVRGWRNDADAARAVAALDALEAAWPDVALPPTAAAPLLALSATRFSEGGDDGVRTAAALAARARRLDPAAAAPAGLELAAARLGHEALAAGRLDDAAAMLIDGTACGAIDPARVAEHDLLRLAHDGAFERALSGARMKAAALLWAGAGDAALARTERTPEARARAARRAVERLAAARSDLPPGSAARAAFWVRRSLNVLEAGGDTAEVARGLELLVDLLLDAGEVEEARRRLDAEGGASGRLRREAVERLRARCRSEPPAARGVR